jgi:hypothetical protein
MLFRQQIQHLMEAKWFDVDNSFFFLTNTGSHFFINLFFFSNSLLNFDIFLKLVSCFFFLIELFQSHDITCGFGELTQVDSPDPFFPF